MLSVAGILGRDRNIVDNQLTMNHVHDDHPSVGPNDFIILLLTSLLGQAMAISDGQRVAISQKLFDTSFNERRARVKQSATPAKISSVHAFLGQRQE